MDTSNKMSSAATSSDDAGGGGGGGGEDEEGRVYVWRGYHGDSAVPRRLRVPCSVLQVSVGGAGHVAMVTESGRLYMYGDNSHGQLGVQGEEGVMAVDVPTLVDALSGVVVSNVACGSRHVVAVTHDGAVYCWGDNRAGQCGHSDTSRLPLPTPVPLSDASPPCHHDKSKRHEEEEEEEQGVRVLQCSAGDLHTIVLSDYGEVWTWGTGVGLGLANIGSGPVPPTRLDYLQGRRVLSVCAGACHNLILVQKLVQPRTVVPNRRSASVDSSASTASRDSIPTSQQQQQQQQQQQAPRYRPATCAKCRAEVNGFDELDEIEEEGKCPLGLAVRDSARSASTSTLTALVPGSLPNPKIMPPLSSTDVLEARRRSSSASVSSAGVLAASPLSTGAPSQSTAAPNLSAPAPLISTDAPRNINTNAALKRDSFASTSAKNTAEQEDHTKLSEKTEQLVEESTEQKIGTIKETIREESKEAETAIDDPNESTASTPTDTNDSSISSGSPSTESKDGIELGEVMTTSTGSIRAGGVTKSRSIFLQDEEEAKVFLEKQLYGDDDVPNMTGSAANNSTTTPPMSPLVKTVGNFLSYVPTQQAAAMQEYVTCVTKTVVSNIKTSVGKSIDKIGSIYSSTDEEKSTVPGSPDLNSPTDEDMEKLENSGDFSRYGTLPKSTSLGALRLRGHWAATRGHQRKGSLPSGAITLDTHQGNPGGCTADVVLDTEVWSWGRGNYGQLGHGDQLDRNQPCPIKMFRDSKVIRVVCGYQHSMVIMASSHVYVWGRPDGGRLGHPELLAATPYCIKVPSSTPVWDIAAGKEHSVLLSDGVPPQLYYTGRQYSEDSFTSELTRMEPVDKHGGCVHSISAGGPVSVCVVSGQHVLHEFAASERSFHTGLDHVTRKVIKPLLASESFRAIEGSPTGMTLHMLCRAFLHLTDSVAINHVELAQVIRRQRSLQQLRLVAKAEKCAATFQHYVKCLADVLAIGAISYCVKAASGFWEKVKDHVQHAAINSQLLGSEVSKMDDKLLVSTLTKLFHLPYNRLTDYYKWSNALAQKSSPYGTEYHMLSQMALSWQNLKTKATDQVSLATTTHAYWETCTPKILEQIRIPRRRLLRSSKKHSLSLHAAGRFSSHTFLLFNDVLVHQQYSSVTQYFLQTIWVEALHDSATYNYAIKLTMPEESLILTAQSGSEKAEWLYEVNRAIGNQLNEDKHIRNRKDCGPLTPPRDRHASHVFSSKTPALRDAKYSGMWRMGSMHGHGELCWADGKKYVGRFKDGLQEGYGTLSLPRRDEDIGAEEQEGYWEQGKLHGLGTIRYANGSMYKGYFKEGKRHGHGVLKQGKITSSTASIYIGEWNNDKRNGYGVLDDVAKGEKYMGFWQDDQRHGNGVIVTLLGMYFEGSFIQNKMTGYGLLITEDHSYYEGEFSGGPNLYGRGTLTLPNGDYIDGHFNGSFTEGIKVSGTFYKCADKEERKNGEHVLINLPKSFGKVSVPASRKWEELFDMCCVTLGCSEKSEVNTAKAWEKVASMVAMGHKYASDDRLPQKERSRATTIPDDLEKIPNFTVGKLSTEHYSDIKQYLTKAVDTAFHPLGRLMEGLVDVYWATYVGVGAQPRLLYHAVNEVKAFVDRLYPIIRILFPDLPDSCSPVVIFPQDYDEHKDMEEEDDDDVSETVTPASLLHPLLLPKIYPPLFTLYALFNEKEDERYWRRVCHWNKQPDLALMSYLGVKQKFWLMEDIESLTDAGTRLSVVKDRCYNSAIETLQRISTLFSPTEKLELIRNTFTSITKVVQGEGEGSHLWCMDDLLPVTQYVVVRARIQHLGAEIHFIDNLMEKHLEFGELSIMFTTLKACHHQIMNEKLT